VELFAHQRGLALETRRDQKLRILIVDDDVDVAHFISELFDDGVNRVITEVAHNGFAAGMQVKSFQPDILLTDLMMPEMNGIEVCRLLKSQPETRGIRIIGVTGYYTPENVNLFLEAGAEICLRKPIDPVELYKIVGLDASEFMTA
jgi:CheY-like chemotaxis protein